MTVYVASSLKNVQRVKEVMMQLSAHGIKVSYDWTAHGFIDDNSPLKQEVAHREVDGIDAADAVLAVMPGERGTHFEIGYAYARRKPIIILYEDASSGWPAFHYLNSVVRCHHLHEAIIILKGIIQ